MNRRDLLKAAPAAALVGVAPVVAETPILALLRRHRELSAAGARHPSMDDAVLNSLFYDEMDRIEDEMLAIPSQTPADMAAKMIVAHGHDGASSCLDFDGKYWAEARALTA